MDVSLVMFKADGTRRDFPVKKDRIVIGRKPTCDLRIPLSSVSRQHCAIEFDGDTVTVRDLGSSNGTLHNSVRVQEQALSAGDEVTVGPVVFTIVIDGEPAEIEPVRSLIEDHVSGQSSGGSGATAAHESSPTPSPDAGGSDAEAELEPELEPEIEPEPADAAASSADSDADADTLGADAPDRKQDQDTDTSDAADVDMDMDDPLAALERMAEAEDDAGGDEPLSLDDDVFDLDDKQPQSSAAAGEGADESDDDPLSALQQADESDTGEVEIILDEDDEDDDDEEGDELSPKRGKGPRKR